MGKKLFGEKVIRGNRRLRSGIRGNGWERDKNLYIELLHFIEHLQVNLMSNAFRFEMCKIVCENNYDVVYPNVHIALRIFMSMMVSNCTGERSFSVLRHIKNYLRSTQDDERLSSLALLCIESELILEINFDS